VGFITPRSGECQHFLRESCRDLESPTRQPGVIVLDLTHFVGADALIHHRGLPSARQSQRSVLSFSEPSD